MKRVFNYLFIILISLFFVTEVKASGFLVEDFSVKDKSTTMEVDNINIEDNIIDSNIKFNEKDDYVIFEFNVRNDEDNSYSIESITDNNDNDHIDVSYDYSKEEIEPNNVTKVVVTIKYTDKLINTEKQKIDNLKINISFKDIDDDNPNTYDNILIYIGVFIISLMYIIILTKKYKKAKVLFIIPLVILMPIVLYALNKVSIDITFVNIELNSEYETYNINVDENNGNNYNIDVTYGQSVGTLEAPVKNGYNFVKWTDDEGNTVNENTEVTKPITITANYEAINYAITYNLDGGSTNNPASFTIEDEVVLSDAVKDGYTFEGWFDNENFNGDKITKIEEGSTGEKVFYAKWSIIEYNLTYVNNGGSGDANPPTYTVNDEIDLHTLTKEGYDFNGWYDNSTFSGSAISKINTGTTGDMTLYAKFTPKIYTVTYNVDGGSHTNPLTYTIEDEVTLLDAIKVGYSFEGWYANDEFTGDKVTKIELGTMGDKEFYAKYEPIEYTITYNLNDGSFNGTPTTEYTIETDTFDLLIPIKSNYRFMGWYEKSDFTGNTTNKITKGTTGNKVLYAKWEALKEYVDKLLYEVVEDGAIGDSEASLFVDNANGIDFSSTSSITNGNGKYLIGNTYDQLYPTYYYRGAVVDNNVLFAGKCWLILRTTETGGVKLVYNGLPDDGKCTATGTDTFISSKVKYNSSYNKVESIGYTYNGSHTQTGKVFSTLTQGMVLANDVVYEDGKYYLQDTYTVGADFQDNREQYTTHHHYTCLNTSTSCEKVNYIFMGRDNGYYYIILTNGDKVDDIIENKNFNPDTTTNSTIKPTVDNFYANNLTTYNSFIEDTIYCNDRSAYTKGGWDKDTTIYEKVAFGPTARASMTFKPSLSCKNVNDSYTVSTSIGNGVLTYPIGLITADEAVYAGYGWFKSTDSYLNNGHIWWTMSPSVLSANYAYVDVLYSILDNVRPDYISSSAITAGGVRPVISIVYGTKVKNGNGTRENPYVIDE